MGTHLEITGEPNTLKGVCSVLRVMFLLYKTTISINFAACLADMGYKTLLIDFDAQGNSSRGVGIEGNELSIYDCLVNDDIPIADAIIKTEFDNLHLVCANIKLANTEIELSGVIGRETILSDLLDELNDYDYVIIDCTPSLGILTINAMSAADYVIIPMENSSIFAMDGIQELLKIIKIIKHKINRKLDIAGVLTSKADDRTVISREFKEDIVELFGDKVFKTSIHTTIKIPESQAKKKPVIHYDKKSKAAREFYDFTREILENG